MCDIILVILIILFYLKSIHQSISEKIEYLIMFNQTIKCLKYTKTTMKQNLYRGVEIDQVHIDKLLKIKFDSFYYWSRTDKHYPLNQTECEFITKIIQSDIEYLENNWVNMFLDIWERSDYNDRIKVYIQISSMFSLNSLVIELLSNHFNFDVKTIFNFHSLIYLCRHNTNVEIIKYLVEQKNVDVNQGDGFGYLPNCLSYAMTSRNYNIVKYLIDEQHMNLKGHFLTLQDIDLHENSDILYLIDKVHCQNLFWCDDINLEKIHTIIPLIKDNKKLNHLLGKLKSSRYIFESKFIEIIKTLNPLRLSESLRDEISFNLNDLSFKQWIKLCDELKGIGMVMRLDEIIKHSGKIAQSDQDNDNNILAPTQSDQREQLFEHNGIIYYGSRDKMYRSMEIFNEMDHCIIFDPLIRLEGKEPKYLIDLYVEIAHNSTLDPMILDKVLVQDIEHFVKFINRYQLTVLSIEKMEFMLMAYFKKHCLKYGECMQNICMINRLRAMYCDILNLWRDQ